MANINKAIEVGGNIVNGASSVGGKYLLYKNYNTPRKLNNFL
ncbi:hypothetical protein [Aliarcobacter cryaerophilus]|nr:hypothetical protein [Aliarcobacter cryaerophilus]MCT7482724.1 hypothetical protein [Aliarcobacter cryaerophilus]